VLIATNTTWKVCIDFKKKIKEIFFNIIPGLPYLVGISATSFVSFE